MASSRSGPGSRSPRSASSRPSGWPSTVGFELTRPLLLGAGALALVVIVAIWRFFPPPLAPRRARISLGLRAVIVLLLSAALAGFQVQTTPSAQSLLVVADLSASVQSALDSEAAAVRRILQQRQGDNRAGVLSFGRDPEIEVNIGKDPQFGEFQSQPNPHYTDIAAALQLGGSILPEDGRKHIVLISDGRANLGDAVGEARLLRAEGIRVDTVALPVPQGAEAYVDRLDAPRTLTQGQQASAQALIVSNTPTQATVRWYLDRTLVNTTQLELPAGETTVKQTIKPQDPGFHAVRVVIDAVRDTYAENNLGEALIQVVGPPRVLLVENTLGEAASLEAALHSTGVGTASTTPERLPRSAADLAAYQAVVLVNIPASSLGSDAMALLQASDRDLGTGLVVIGGADSYGPGGYAGTPLETALPVQIQLPQDMQKPPVAVVLVLESAESSQGDQIVRGAAEAVVDQLTPRDKIAISNGAMGPFVVSLSPLTDKVAVKRQIEAMSLGDPPSYAPDLTAADQALSHTTAAIKHVIFLGDGDAQDNYQPIVTAMHAHGITVTTVAIGANGPDAAMLQQMAGWGHGRFYQSNSLSDIPQIFIKETREALKPWIVEGRIAPQLASLADVIPGVPLDSFPVLSGYVATTPRAAADVVFFFSSRRRHTGCSRDWSSDVCSSDLSVYGRSKLEGEGAVRAANPRALVLRTTVVYGPEPQGKNFVYQLLRRAQTGDRLTVPTDQRSSPTYNADLAAASVELAERGVAGVFHLAGPVILDRHAFALTACEVFGLDPSFLVPATTAELGQRAARPLNAGLKSERVRALLETVLRGPKEGLAAMRTALAGH